VAFLVAPDRRFGRYAIGGFAVAIGTGVLLAIAHLGSPSAVVSTAYGWALLIKAAIVAVGLASFSLPRLRGRVGVGVLFPVGAAALILVAAAVLVSLPPPR
jgi:copper transport protein